MKNSFITGITALGCVLMASCYPYPEPPPRRSNQNPDASVTSPEQQKLQQQRDEMKRKEAEAQNGTLPPAGPDATTTQGDTSPKPPVETKRAEYKFADPVPGKPGFVFSPYNNKVVDVRDIPSGTLVQDPTYPVEQKKYFRVP